MLIVADTSPLNYLILLNKIDILPRLYGQVVVPEPVQVEMMHCLAPAAVQTWAKAMPSWIEIRKPIGKPMWKEVLGAGESAAILLATELRADQLLIDERIGRGVAEGLGITSLGTLGVLRDAALEGFLDLGATFDELKRMSFRASSQLFEEMLQEVRRAKME